jgi:transcriptional regulator
MYTPEHFRPDDATVQDLLTGIVAGNLVTSTDSGLAATFLSALYDPALGAHGALLAHVARNNDQWKRTPNDEALFICDVLDGYVTPSWYASKAEHGRVVPTWNYVTVHAFGDLIVHDDPAWLETLVRRLTIRHETTRPDPWSVDDAPEAYIAGQLRAIVGIEVRLSRVETKVKMSQNRPRDDIDGVADGYFEEGRVDMAAWVRRPST